MKLWKLEPIESTYRSKTFSYDCHHGFIVRAETEHEARNIADTNCADEGPVWSDPAITSCEEISADGPSGVVMADFHAG